MKKNNYVVDYYSIYKSDYIDSLENIEYVDDKKGIYIRQILDSASTEFQFSKLLKSEKLLIIQDLGFENLSLLLGKCFKEFNKPYNYLSVSKFSYAILTDTLKEFGETLIESDNAGKTAMEDVDIESIIIDKYGSLDNCISMIKKQEEVDKTK